MATPLLWMIKNLRSSRQILFQLRLCKLYERRGGVYFVFMQQAATCTMIVRIDHILFLNRHFDAVISYQKSSVESHWDRALPGEMPRIRSFFGVNMQVGFGRVA